MLLSASRLDAPPRILDVLVLSPLGVLPKLQNRRIGTRLIEHALATAEGQGVPLLFLEGSPDYCVGLRDPEPATADSSHPGR